MNYHLYQALKKSLYKPAAFYKGIVIPLVESGVVRVKRIVTGLDEGGGGGNRERDKEKRERETERDRETDRETDRVILAPVV